MRSGTSLQVTTERWPLAGSFAISRGAKTEAAVVVATISSGPHTGRGECVPYARKLTNIQIRGNAWTWWDAAKGRYRRGRQPAVGAVLVLRRKGRSLGHLAVVTEVVSDRVVVASHANWLNRGKIHMDTPIHDVSRSNDWSAVKIWYTPGNVLGRSAYPAYGFIYPGAQSAAR